MQHLLYKIFVVAILTVLFAVALGGISQNSRWKITTIKISGVNAVSEEAVWLLTGKLLEGNHYFLYARDNSLILPQREIKKKLLPGYQ